MLATKERIQGHYEVTKTPFATDYVWVEGEEEVECCMQMGQDRAHPRN
jgi:hypothetical protein